MALIVSSAGHFFKTYRSLILISAFTYFSLLFLLPEHHFVYDLKCWQEWSCLIHEHGLAAAYDPDLSRIDYMPLYLYVLKAYTVLEGDIAPIRDHINSLKAVTLFFEVLSVALIAGMNRNTEKRLLYFIIGILNIGFLYNSLFWHQVDGILAFLLLASFLCALKKQTLWSVIFFVLAFNFKIQAVCLLPMLGLMWLDGIKLKNIFAYLGSAILLQIVIILPFLLKGNAKNILKIVFNSYDHYENVSLNAYNIWYLLLKGFPPEVSDKTTWLALPYHFYGLLLYVMAVVVIISPLAYTLFTRQWQTRGIISTKFLVLSAALLPYVFFYFNTQMHERYIHCSMIFLTFLAFQYGHWALYFMVTMNYYLSLESLLSINRFLASNASFLFGMKTQAVVFTIGLAWLFILWHREWKTPGRDTRKEFIA